MPDQDEKTREALKEAIKEWMDEKYAEIGKWAVQSFIVAALGALGYFILSVAGWHK